MRALVAFAALPIAACVAAPSPLAPRTVDAGYVSGGGHFSTGTHVAVRATAFEQDGRVAVCAATALDGVTAPTVPYQRRVLDTGVVRLGSRNLLQGLSGFPRAASASALDGTPAGCVVTGHAWRADDGAARLRVDFPRLVLERDEESGYTLWFTGD